VGGAAATSTVAKPAQPVILPTLLYSTAVTDAKPKRGRPVGSRGTHAGPAGRPINLLPVRVDAATYRNAYAAAASSGSKSCRKEDGRDEVDGVASKKKKVRLDPGFLSDDDDNDGDCNIKLRAGGELQRKQSFSYADDNELPDTQFALGNEPSASAASTCSRSAEKSRLIIDEDAAADAIIRDHKLEHSKF